jgi:hypothetical protein
LSLVGFHDDVGAALVVETCPLLPDNRDAQRIRRPDPILEDQGLALGSVRPYRFREPKDEIAAGRW